jgi:hypothetical protein
MAVRIFLDFDGVLRRESSPKSRLDADCIESFEDAVQSQAEARIVIASTWRLVHGLDALRSYFSEEVRGRVEGITPDIPDVENYVRHAEVLAYLNRRGLQNTRWIAVDDDAEQFKPGAPLIHVDPSLGFNKECGQRLSAWLMGQ